MLKTVMDRSWFSDQMIWNASERVAGARRSRVNLTWDRISSLRRCADHV
jgi:hypothetical protein